MRLIKTLGYINLLSRCFHSGISRAEGFLFRNLTNRNKFITDGATAGAGFSFSPVASMESNGRETAYPSWGYVKSPEHENYKIVERRYNKNFDITYTVYEHKRTKTQILFVGSNDPLDVEQGFVYYVKTLPHTDKGISHILEHSVLDGSKKYKDPFNTLMRGSLFTLLNAATYTDRTVYYARSMNNRDFLNILDVYTDAVFSPTVLEDELSFRQEGWSYMLEELTEDEKKDETIPKINGYGVVFGGVVFNEMKGVFSNPLRIISYESEKILFSDTVLSKVSGGDPKEIPNLTYNEFKDYYYKNYNPQKIKLFATSNRSSKELLDQLDDYLQKIDLSVYKGTGDVENVEFQTYKEGPFYKVKKYASSAEEKESMVLISWVINPKKGKDSDPDLTLNLPLDSFVLSILNYLLIQTSTSILHKALIQSGLGTSVMSDMVDNELIQHVFSVGLKGIVEKDNKGNNNEETNIHFKVEQVVMDALNRVVENGFNMEAVEAAFNSFEFRLKELNLDNAKSTNLVLEMISKLNYGRDPLESLEYDKYIRQIKENIRLIPRYLENFVKKYLIDNKHRAVVLLKGDSEIGKQMDLDEEAEIRKRIQNLPVGGKDQIYEVYEKLKERQQRKKENENKDDDNIPTLSRSDLNEKTLEIPATLYFMKLENNNDFEMYKYLRNNKHEVEKNMKLFKEVYVLNKTYNNAEVEKIIRSSEIDIRKDIPIVIHEVRTDGIVYFEMGISLDEFNLEDFYYLKLFELIMLENKTNTKSEEEFVNFKEKNLGRLKASVNTYSTWNGLNVFDLYNIRAMFSVEFHALNHKSNDGFKIALEALRESDMSNKAKVIEILERMINGYRTSFNESANSILVNHIRSHLNASRYMKNLLSGYNNYLKVLEILKMAKSDYDSVKNRLLSIREKIFNSSKVILTVTADEESLRHVLTESKESIRQFFSFFPYLGNKEDNIIRWREELIKSNFLNRNGRKDLLVTESLVNYVGTAGILFEPGNFMKPSYEVVVSALKNNYAWRRIREANGAYGVMSSLSYDGILMFCSYRDPQLEKTLEVYKDLAKGLREMVSNMTEKDLLRYIIYIIRMLDKPKRGLELGTTSFWRILTNETEEDRIKYREYIMSTTKQDFLDFANILEEKAEEMKKNIAIVTSPEKSQKFAKTNPDFNTIQLQ